MSDTTTTFDLTLLGAQMRAMQADVRAINRDIAMLRAGQADQPTHAQFSAGLTVLDARSTELAEMLASKIDTDVAALGQRIAGVAGQLVEHVTDVGKRFDAIEAKLDALLAR